MSEFPELTDNIFKNDADGGQVGIIGRSNPLSLTGFVEALFQQSTRVEYKTQWAWRRGVHWE